MSKVFLAGFKAGRNRYEHTVETTIDETFIHNQETEERLYNTNAGGWTHNKRGHIAGRFHKMDSGRWYYETIDKATRINTKFTDRYEAERDVFTVLLTFGVKE